MNEARISKARTILIIGWIALVLVPAVSWGGRVLSIRHGVHPDFDRVVFDLSARSEYNVDTRQSGRSIYVTIEGISPDAPEPAIHISRKSNIVALVNPMGGGTYQICLLKSVATRSFTIPGATYRIVIDLYPEEENGDSSQSFVPTPDVVPLAEKTPEDSRAQLNAEKSVPEKDTQDSPTEELADSPPPQGVIVKPLPEKLEDHLTAENAIDTIPKSSSYCLNSLYNLKQSAMQYQVDGEVDSASACWEQYLTIAKQLRKGLVGEDLASSDPGQGSVDSSQGKTSMIGRIVFIFVPIALAILIFVIWIIDRFSFASLFRKNGKIPATQEEKAEPKPMKATTTPVGQPAAASVEKQTETGPEEAKVQPAEEHLEESAEGRESPEESLVEEVVNEGAEEAALKEFFEAPEEPSAEEEKVKRILELAGEEKSIAEIAEEMGIGEDEVRLVLDLQGHGVPVEDHAK